jgi:hypothetical protein
LPTLRFQGLRLQDILRRETATGHSGTWEVPVRFKLERASLASPAAYDIGMPVQAAGPGPAVQSGTRSRCGLRVPVTRRSLAVPGRGPFCAH